jgi:excisionase family DNA binding protein
MAEHDPVAGTTPTTPNRRERRAALIAVEAPMADSELLTPNEVAELFRVNPKTVARWARAGKVSAVRTLGGHRRYRASDIRRFLEAVQDLPA